MGILWAQSIPPAASPGAGRAAGLSEFSLAIPMVLSAQGELCLGHFVLGPGRDAGCDLDEG